MAKLQSVLHIFWMPGQPDLSASYAQNSANEFGYVHVRQLV